jgi:hypothetical protein
MPLFQMVLNFQLEAKHIHNNIMQQIYIKHVVMDF